MKKKSTFTLAAAMLISSMAGCGVKKNDRAGEEIYSNGMALDSVEIYDSITANGSCKALCKISVMYPTGDNTVDDSVRAWIADRLAYSYKDNSTPSFTITKEMQNNVPEMAKLACDSLLNSSRRDFNSMKGFSINYTFDYSIDTVYTAPSYITYCFNSYCYLGGAHGGSMFQPATFSKADGTMLTWDNTIKRDDEPAVIAMIKRELAKQFFTPESGWTMDDGLLVSPDSIKLPVTPPLFDAEGLVVTYQQYEISPYAAGMPSCVLPLDSIASSLTPTAKATVMPDDASTR